MIRLLWHEGHNRPKLLSFPTRRSSDLGEDKSSLGGRPNPADGSSALPCSNPGGWKRFLVAQHSQALANWRCIARLWAKGSRRQAFCAHVRVLSGYLRWPLPCLAELGAATADIRPRTHGRDLSEYLAPYQAMMEKGSAGQRALRQWPYGEASKGIVLFAE